MSDDDLLPDAPSDAEWQPIRAALREVDVPHDARESALAAALAAFDELHAEAPAAAAAAPVVHLSARRPRAQRWLTAAAAVVAVLAVGGVVAKRVISPANDNDSNVAVPALDSSLADPARSTAAAEEKTTAADPNAADPNAADAVAAAAPEAVATTMAPAVVLEAAPEGGGVAPPSTIGSIDGAASTGATTVIDSPESLAAYARSTDSTGRGAVAGSASACVPPGSEALGTVVYLQQEAVVVRNPDTGEVSALDRLSCAVLASVTP